MRNIALLAAGAFLAGCAVNIPDAGKSQREVEAANAGSRAADRAGQMKVTGR
ncbi:MAG: hypothetical protein WKF52_10390 [Sphingomicrobium sp.]